MLKQDKGQGVLILKRRNYIEKCLRMLDSDRFKKLMEDPTKTIETKGQQTLRHIRHVFFEGEYHKLYVTGSKPGAFYKTAKFDKQKSEGLDTHRIKNCKHNLRNCKIPGNVNHL